jgi:hypothetical protein
VVWTAGLCERHRKTTNKEKRTSGLAKDMAVVTVARSQEEESWEEEDGQDGMLIDSIHH